MIAAGLAGRSALDKVLALRGGGELVALWAQIASLMELVSGASLERNSLLSERSTSASVTNSVSPRPSASTAEGVALPGR